MIINLNITRMRRNNELWEIFSAAPNVKYNVEPSRQIYFALWKARCENSLHDKLKLIDIKYTDKNIIHIYEFNNIQAEYNKNIPIQYNPVLGSKKCSKCYHEIIINKKSYCNKRGKENTKNRWYKCLYWKEKSLNVAKENHGGLYHKSGSIGNGTPNKRIYG